MNLQQDGSVSQEYQYISNATNTELPTYTLYLGTCVLPGTWYKTGTSNYTLRGQKPLGGQNSTHFLGN